MYFVTAALGNDSQGVDIFPTNTVYIDKATTPERVPYTIELSPSNQPAKSP